jgi:hypothetical protein
MSNIISRVNHIKSGIKREIEIELWATIWAWSSGILLEYP